MDNELLDFTDDVMLRQAKMASALFKNADKYKAHYAAQLSDYDLQIQDILHYIEFTKLSGAGYLKAAKKLKELLGKRRKAKHYMAFCVTLEHDTCRSKTLRQYLDNPTKGGGDTYKIRTKVLKEVFGYDGKTLN